MLWRYSQNIVFHYNTNAIAFIKNLWRQSWSVYDVIREYQIKGFFPPWQTFTLTKHKKFRLYWKSPQAFFNVLMIFNSKGTDSKYCSCSKYLCRICSTVGCPKCCWAIPHCKTFQKEPLDILVFLKISSTSLHQINWCLRSRFDFILSNP